nr:MAG TPA: hypothetical protein [Caudoviricetes sp.]
MRYEINQTDNNVYIIAVRYDNLLSLKLLLY